MGNRNIHLIHYDYPPLKIPISIADSRFQKSIKFRPPRRLPRIKFHSIPQRRAQIILTRRIRWRRRQRRRERSSLGHIETFTRIVLLRKGGEFSLIVWIWSLLLIDWLRRLRIALCRLICCCRWFRRIVRLLICCRDGSRRPCWTGAFCHVVDSSVRVCVFILSLASQT